MNLKMQFTLDRATQLGSQTMTGRQFATLLNDHGFLTSYGTPFRPGTRGVFRLIDAVYARLIAEGRLAEAEAVAAAFTKDDGSYAWV